MKKLVILLAGMLMVAAPALALIDNSKHDLPGTYYSGGNTNDEVCVFCHTPHGANVAFTGGPLWNRNESATALTGTYSSATLNASISAANNYKEIDAAACMSCHDGTQAMNTLVNPPNTTPGGTYNTTLSGRATDLGTNMNNDHPVNFIYETAQAADGGGTYAFTALPSTIQTGFKISGANHIMQCSSCHDVHNTVGQKLILINNAGSNLCLACHAK